MVEEWPRPARVILILQVTSVHLSCSEMHIVSISLFRKITANIRPPDSIDLKFCIGKTH